MFENSGECKYYLFVIQIYGNILHVGSSNVILYFVRLILLVRFPLTPFSNIPTYGSTFYESSLSIIMVLCCTS